jgi:hypothetical protein
MLVFNRDLLAFTMVIEFCTARREPIHVGSLKDPSFRRPTKLIAIAHRKSLPPLKSDEASSLMFTQRRVNDKSSL